MCVIIHVHIRESGCTHVWGQYTMDVGVHHKRDWARHDLGGWIVQQRHVVQLHQHIKHDLVSRHTAQLGKWKTQTTVNVHGLAVDVCFWVLGARDVVSSDALLVVRSSPKPHTVHHCCVSTYARLLVGVVHPEQSNCVAGLSMCVTGGIPDTFHRRLGMDPRFTRRRLWGR